jgi:hypothetical protein
VLVIGPILRASQRGEDRLATADQQLQVMQRLRRDYDDVQGRLADVEQRIQRGARSELRTTLESLAQQASVKVESMEPQASPAHPKYRETKVEVGLKSVTLAQTVHYLHQIDIAPQALSVKSLRDPHARGAARPARRVVHRLVVRADLMTEISASRAACAGVRCVVARAGALALTAY